MSDTFDVVVAGAGPAGGQCARDLAARDHDVLVLETEGKAEYPAQSNKSTAGTFPSTMAGFGIPDDVVMNFTDAVVLESPNDYTKRQQSGAVLEFGDFKQWLVDEGRAAGAEYRFDSRVRAPILDDEDRIVGVRYGDGEEVSADIVVDATGPGAPLAKELGVCDLQRERQAVGIEYEMEGVRTDVDGYADLTDTMMLRLDHEDAPGGYAWIFHTGADTAKVGICYIQNEVHIRRAKADHTIDDYLTEWIERDPRLQEATRLAGKQHRGSAHIQLPSKIHTDNFLAIGDAVPTVDPLWGEGIGKCMRSGRAAAIAADNALTHSSRDTSAETLAVYEDYWHSEVAPNQKTRLLMTDLLYRASNNRYDMLMRDLDSLGKDTLSKANGGSKRAIAKLLKLRDVPELVGFAWEHATGKWSGNPR